MSSEKKSKESSGISAVELANKYRALFSPHLSEKMNLSALYVDLSDIYEISKWYVKKVEDIAKKEVISRDEIQDEIIEFRVQLIEHMNIHLRSLMRLWPRVEKDVFDE